MDQELVQAYIREAMCPSEHTMKLWITEIVNDASLLVKSKFSRHNSSLKTPSLLESV